MNDSITGSKTHLELLNLPQGNCEKLLLLIPVDLVLFIIFFFPSKAAFYLTAKLQEFEVVPLQILYTSAWAHFTCLFLSPLACVILKMSKRIAIF